MATLAELKRENKQLRDGEKVLLGCIRDLQRRIESYEHTCGELANELSQLKLSIISTRKLRC